MSATLESRLSRLQLPAQEQAVVSELAQVLRRYADQAPARLAELITLAYGTVALGRNASREQQLAHAHFRGLEVRQKLVEAEGGSWSSEEVARMLQISKTAVLKRLAAGRLLAWREERLQAARFPRWQFDDHGQVLAGLEEVLAILDRDERLDVWGKVLFFLQEKPALGGQRPLDRLRAGKLADVRRAAEAYVE